MIHKRKGFTLVEIALFLAITGLLFAGIIVGTNNSIFQQRFNDTVQNYTEFLRSIYSEVSNPQSVGDGRSEVAIYGKLISFGQTVGLDGNDFDDDRAQRIYVYDIVGDVVGTGTGTAVELLKNLNANVVFLHETDDGNVKVEPAGIVESYIPRWGASIEKAGSREMNDNIENIYKGTILVVRHPRSGTINTLVSSKVLDINAKIKEANEAGSRQEKENVISGLLTSSLDSFDTDTVDFCINPYGVDKFSDLRRDIRIVKNARNASGVEMIDMDDSRNVCRETN